MSIFRWINTLFIQAVINSTKLYTCLYKACLEKELYALARVTFRANMAPKMCALIPQARIPYGDEQVGRFN